MNFTRHISHKIAQNYTMQYNIMVKKSQGFQGRINEKYTNENYFHYLVKKKTF